MLNKILNREDFAYDATQDPLYQQYVTQYRQESDRARQETLADAAASAGGMNSYAITAAQQASDYYNSQLANKIPELYQLAYSMYLDDKASMVEDLGLLQSMDSTQYNRYRDTMSDYYNDKNFAYGLYQDAVSQGNFEKEFAYNQLINDRNYYYQIGRDNVLDTRYDNEWNNTLSQQEIANNRYNDSLAKEDELRAQEEAKEQAYALLELGQMPSSDLLKAAGIDESFATAYLKGIQAQMTSKSSGSGGGGDGEKKVDDNPAPKDPEGDDDKPVDTGMTEEQLVAKAAKEVSSPNLTGDALNGMLSLGWIVYDEDEDKFKRTMDFGKGLSTKGVGFAALKN
jgi:hypothetical protein